MAGGPPPRPTAARPRPRVTKNEQRRMATGNLIRRRQATAARCPPPVPPPAANANAEPVLRLCRIFLLRGAAAAARSPVRAKAAAMTSAVDRTGPYVHVQVPHMCDDLGIADSDCRCMSTSIHVTDMQPPTLLPTAAFISQAPSRCRGAVAQPSSGRVACRRRRRRRRRRCCRRPAAGSGGGRRQLAASKPRADRPTGWRAVWVRSFSLACSGRSAASSQLPRQSRHHAIYQLPGSLHG